jgi:salicylate hydroxylase
MIAERKITVLGAGVAGLAVARALALRGARVTVLEQAPAITEVGAGLQISQNGFKVIAALGLGDALRACGIQSRAIVLHDHAGAPVMRMDLTRRPDRVQLLVHRADLIDILLTGARDAGATVRTGYAVQVVDLSGLHPRLTLADGSLWETDLLIGADGVQSRVRAVLNPETPPFFTGQVAWRALIANPGQGPEAHVHMGPGRHLVCYPLRDGAVLNIVAVQERSTWAAEGWNQPDDPGHLRAAFADFGGPVRGLLARVEQAHLWGLFRHPVAHIWGQGPAAILGDAAHPTLPFLAQGANLALEDAWVLARCLDDGKDALPRYQALRRPRTERVIAAANGNAWKFHLRHPLARGLAHAALRLGNVMAPDRMLAQFDWIYDHDVTAASS